MGGDEHQDTVSVVDLWPIHTKETLRKVTTMHKYSYLKKLAIGGVVLFMGSTVVMTPSIFTTRTVLQKVAHADSKTDVTTVTDFDSTHTYTGANTAAKDIFSVSGNGSQKILSTSGSAMEANLTNDDRTGDVGTLAFQHQLSFSSDFSIQGQIYYSSTGGDGISMLFAPVDPNKIGSGKPGAGLGLWGLPNSFALVFDMYANNFDTHSTLGINTDDNPNMGDFNNKDAKNASKTSGSAGNYKDGMSAVVGNAATVNPLTGKGIFSGSAANATEQVVNWRYTDGSGKLVAVDGANTNKVLGSNPGNQVVSVNKDQTKGYEDITMSYVASTGVLTVSIPKNQVGNIDNQTYPGTVDAKTWTLTIPAAYKTQGYSLGVVAADSTNSGNNFKFKLTNYTMPVAYSKVTFDGKANAKTTDPSDFKFTKSAAATANVGDVITVIPDASYLSAAQALPNYDPAYVYVAPKVKGYVLTAPQQFMVSQDVTQNNYMLDYSKVGTMTVHYQLKGQAAGSYIDDVVVKNNANVVSGVEGDSYAIATPLLPGYSADKTSISGKLLAGDATALVTYTPVNVSPLNPAKPDVSQPVKPIDTVTGSGVGDAGGSSLSVDFAPSLSFGTQTIADGAQKYSATAQKYSDGTATSVPYVQVTDRRPNKSGWKLNAVLSDFKDKDGNVLPVSSLSYKNGAIKVANDASLTTQNTVGEQMSSSFTTNQLIPNVQSTIIAANTGEGHGTFLGEFGSASDLGTATNEADGKGGNRTVDNALTLNVPNAQNAKSTEYDASITWTLADTPSN